MITNYCAMYSLIAVSITMIKVKNMDPIEKYTDEKFDELLSAKIISCGQQTCGEGAEHVNCTSNKSHARMV